MSKAVLSQPIVIVDDFAVEIFFGVTASFIIKKIHFLCCLLFDQIGSHQSRIHVMPPTSQLEID